MLYPMIWTGQRSGARSAASSGASLHNAYLTVANAGQGIKVPTIITGTPGTARWAEIPALTIGGVTPDGPGIQGLVKINSPIYGRRIFGISSGYHFFEVRLGGTDSNDPPADYNPFTSAPDPLHTATATRIHNFTTNTDKQATGPTRMVSDGRRIMFAIGRNAYMWDMEENSGEGGFVTLTAPTPADSAATLPDEEWADVAWIDSYFFLAAKSGEFFHSLTNSPDFDQLDVAEASADPDALVGLASFNRRLYVFGEESIEQWYHSPRGTDFVFRRDNTWVANIGAASRESIQANEIGVFFLGSDGIVHTIVGNSLRRLSNDDIERDIVQSDISQARAFMYTEEGHRFYSLTLFMDDGTTKNWTLDLGLGVWHTRSMDNVLVVARLLGRNYVGREGNAGLQNMSLRWGSDYETGDDITRRVVGPVMYAAKERLRIHSVSMQPDPMSSGTVQLAKSTDFGANWEDVGNPQTLNQSVVRWNNAQDMDKLLNEAQLNLQLEFTAPGRVNFLNTFMRYIGVP